MREENGGFSVGGGSKSSSDTTAERLPVTPGETDQQQPHVNGENTSATITEPQKVTPAAITGKRELRPSPSSSSPAKRAKLTDDVFVFRCLACAKRGCPYENGYAIFEEAVDCDGPRHPEFDPTEHIMIAAYKTDKERTELYFGSNMKSAVRDIVRGVLKSKGIWSNNKYIGDSRLDSNLKIWARNKLGTEPELVDTDWPGIRHAVKATLAIKRQRSVLLIRDAFFG